MNPQHHRGALAPPHVDGCPHAFARHDGHLLPHYCSYVQAPALLAQALDEGATPDEQCLRAYLASLALWSLLLARELEAVAACKGTPLTLTTYQGIMKRLKRCLAAMAILLEQSALLRTHVLHRRSAAIRFQLVGTPESDLFQGMILTIQQLAWSKDAFAFQQEAVSAQEAWLLLDQLRHTLASLQAYTHPLLLDFEHLLVFLRETPASKQITFRDLVNTISLLELVQGILQAHHPEAATRGTNDELTFLLSHQCSELWMAAANATLSAAIQAMKTHQMLIAVVLVERATAIIELFVRMIRMPQTMSAPDYLRFRQELGGGSGAESEQFRQLELLGGMQDENHLSHLQVMGLLTTNHIRIIEDGGSLHAAFLQVLRQRGVIASLEEAPEVIARLLSRKVFHATGTSSPHSDLLMLAEALRLFEQQLLAWRLQHLQMVELLIGGQRPSLGVGGQAAHGDGRDSRSYLLRTLAYSPLFPELVLVGDVLPEGQEEGMVTE